MATSARGAWRDRLLFLLCGVAEQARDAIRRAKRLQDLQSEWRQQLTQARASCERVRANLTTFDIPTKRLALETLDIQCVGFQASR